MLHGVRKTSDHVNALRETGRKSLVTPAQVIIVSRVLGIQLSFTSCAVCILKFLNSSTIGLSSFVKQFCQKHFVLLLEQP